MEPLTLVLAVADDGAMGLRGGLPWDIPEDRRHFQRETTGRAIIMGRRTWDEVGAALPGRRNIVVTRNRELALPGAEVAGTLEDAIALARTSDPAPCVIGGAVIFRLAWPLATRISLTEVHRKVEADTYFEVDRRGFHETSRRRGTEDPTIEIVLLERD